MKFPPAIGTLAGPDVLTGGGGPRARVRHRTALRALMAVLGATFIACGGSSDSPGSSGGAPGSGGSASGGSGGSGSGGHGGSGGSPASSGGSGDGSGGSRSGGSSGSGSGGAASGGQVGSGGTSGGARSGGATGTSSGGATGTGSGGSGVAGRSGSGGGAASGGTTGAAGHVGSGGGSGTGSGGTGGPSGNCTITATATMGTIPTVAIVTYTTDLTGVTGGQIDFGLPGGTMMTAPIDTTQATPKTLLLGMKGGKSYTYHVTLKAPAGNCTSQDFTFMTGAVPSSVPKPTVTIMNAAMHDKGFLVTSGGLMGTTTEIIDSDGDVVWWATGPSQNSRSHMSWDGSHMYMMSLNVQNSGSGKITYVAMDGSGSTNVTGVAASHHDMTAIPGGFATPLWNKSGTDAPCSLVEFANDTWKTTTVIADMATVYNSSTFHTNAVHYYASDDSYTLGDRNPNLYVKVSRAGALIWQFGGSNPKDAGKTFSGVTTWMVNHGHHLMPDGTFLFFNNNANEAWGYKLNTANMTASKTFMYTASGATSMVLGDVQGLPNGNILITFSTSAQIHEVTPTGTLVMKATTSSTTGFGYSEFRESLYGPPPY